MKRNDYVHSSTLIRTFESKLLSQNQYDRMIDSDSLEDAIHVLQETSYQDSLQGLERPEDYDHAIGKEIKKVYKKVREISPNKDLVDLISLKYDDHNMKIYLKDRVMDTDHKDLVYSFANDEIKSVDEEKEEAFIKAENTALKDLEDPMDISLEVDKIYHQELIKAAEKTGVDLIEKFFRDYIDFSNLISLFRMKDQKRDAEFAERVIAEGGNIPKEEIVDRFSQPIEATVMAYKGTSIGPRLLKGLEEYKENENISAFEKQFDNHKMDLVRDVKYTTYGPEVIFAYLVTREIEIKNIRIILVSKLNKLSQDFIRGRLRETYDA